MLRGDGARLQRALTSFMLDVAREHGYTEVAPPYLVRREAMVGTAQLPKFEDEAYHTDDGLFLIPTAEVPVTNLYAGEILEAAQLPDRARRSHRRAGGARPAPRARTRAGTSACTSSRRSRWCASRRPRRRSTSSSCITSHAEHVLQRLGLHYRVLLMCTGDLGFAQWKKYDVEVWAPGHAAVARGLVVLGVRRLPGAAGQHPLPSARRREAASRAHPQRQRARRAAHVRCAPRDLPASRTAASSSPNRCAPISVDSTV